MKLEICVFFTTIISVLAGTNVNISFTHQHSRTGSKLLELQNDKIQLKATDSLEKYNKNEHGRLARIQIDENKFAEVGNSSKAVNMKLARDATAEYRSDHVQSKERLSSSHSQDQQRSFYNSNREIHPVLGQIRSLSPQDKQNMEFERYIQNYHGGPTVETVYESATPEVQYTLPASSIQNRSHRVAKFERQMSLPSNSDSVLPPTDAIKTILNNHPVTASTTMSLDSSSSPLSPAIPSVNVNRSSKPSSVNKNDFSFDLNYSKPNYNEPTFKYKDEQSEANFYNQFPSPMKEPHNGYSDYYSNLYNPQQIMEGYQPNTQRTVVTKTIQIAQPAIKAKKYEVRHPAIQKEFYDIEERVVIKPAGTVVVELERPSAKILKEETTLPLGHPHPAVAAAYMQSRNTQAFSNIIYSNAGSSISSHPAYQHIPQKAYHESDTPAYSRKTKEANTETLLEERPYVPSTANSQKQQTTEITAPNDGHGSQQQRLTDKLIYNQDRPNKASFRTPFNHRHSFAYEDNSHSNTLTNTTPKRTELQETQDDMEDFSFSAEYISNSGSSNLEKENRPARLQEAFSEEVIDQKQTSQPIIKHEHKIVLPPSQHNIYLNRAHEVPKTKFIKETAEVRNHRRPVIGYATAGQVSELKNVQMAEYNALPRGFLQYESTPQRSKITDADSHMKYSAPYAQVRHNLERNRKQSRQEHREYIASEDRSQPLTVEGNIVPDVENSSNEKPIEKELPQTYINIQIPTSSSDDDNRAIFVSSTITPVSMDDGNDETNNSKFQISVTNNGEPKKEKPLEDGHKSSEYNNENKNFGKKEIENVSVIENKPICDQISKSVSNEKYKTEPETQQKFLRIADATSVTSSSNHVANSAESGIVQSNLRSNKVDINAKSSGGHISPAGSRVIASTSAPKESNPSESFHQRRIVVNHPFQTVREVVEHEPYTNYHEVQVHEPATPAIYHSANYYKSHGALGQSDTRNSPSYYS